MIAALLALTINQQASSTVQLGTVDVGGKQIPVEVPARRGPFNENTPHVEFDGWKFTVDLEGNIGTRYKSDGGWGEVADAYPAAAQKSVSAPEYRIKVFIIESATILEKGHDGTWRRRRGAIGNTDRETIYKSLARMKALAEIAADGKVRITFDVSIDDDLLFKTIDASGHGSVNRQTDESELLNNSYALNVLGREFINEDITPRISNDLFDNEEGIYNGPYSSIFVIHPARTHDIVSGMIVKTPFVSVSWADFTRNEPGTALSVLLFNAWNVHLHSAMMSRVDHHHWSPVLVSPSTPTVFNTPISDLMLQMGNHLNDQAIDDGSNWGKVQETDFTEQDASSSVLSKLPQGQINDFKRYAGYDIDPRAFESYRFRFGFTGTNSDVVFVPPALASRFMTVHPGAKALGIAHGGDTGCDGNDLIGFTIPEALTAKTDLEALQIEQPPVRAIQIVTPPATFGEINFNPTGHGDFDVAFIEDPSEGRAVEITESGSFRRGYAVLASSDGSGTLFKVTEDTALNFKASSDLPESYVLNLVSNFNKRLEIVLYGSSRLPAESKLAMQIVDVSREPGPYWVEYKVKLPLEFAGLNINEIQIAPPQYASNYERKSGGKKSLKIGTISFGPMTDTDPETVPVMNPDIEWLKTVAGPLDDDSRLKMKELLTSTDFDIALNALGAMTRIKDEELLPDIAIHMNSTDSSEAYLATQAVKHLDIDLAWAMIAYVAVKGPMGHNYRFAAEALAAKPEPATLELMNGMMLNRNWRTRRAAVQTIAKIQTEGAGVVAAVALTSDPDPVVRYEVTKQNRPNHELFTRRLLWTAVNDPSEQVRLSSYLAVLDSPFDDIRGQALRGVRDESITIRLALLEAMRTRAKEHYRSALRFAVIDSSPFVRAAALRAFATQPGEVVTGEIQNTFNDDHPAVKQALLELAKAKNIDLPKAS